MMTWCHGGGTIFQLGQIKKKILSLPILHVAPSTQSYHVLTCIQLNSSALIWMLLTVAVGSECITLHHWVLLVAGLHAAFTSLEGGCLCSPSHYYYLKLHVVVMGCFGVLVIKSQSCLCISRSCFDSKTHEYKLVRYHVQISYNLSGYLQRYLVCISCPNRTFLLNQVESTGFIRRQTTHADWPYQHR